MKILQTPLSGVLLVEPDVFRDSRGFFLESYHQKKYADAGLPERFVQDNHSRSGAYILRGLHAQIQHPQGKLVRVIQGEVFDVIVDIRKGSPTFKQWFSVTLSAENFRQCYIPPGYAHGFCVLSETAEMEYKVTDFYNPKGEITVLWNDPDLAIPWPIKTPVLSAKDQAGLRLKDLDGRLPLFQTS